MRRLGGVLAAAVLCGTRGVHERAASAPGAEVRGAGHHDHRAEGQRDRRGRRRRGRWLQPAHRRRAEPITTALSSLLLPVGVPARHRRRAAARPEPDGQREGHQGRAVHGHLHDPQGRVAGRTARRSPPRTSTTSGSACAASPVSSTRPGYRLINNISAREGGKVVEVAFGKPFPGWRSLFANLLPAHLLKDAPGTLVERAVAPTSRPPPGRSRCAASTSRAARSSSSAATGTGRRRPRSTGSCCAGPRTSAMAESLSKGDNQAALLRADAADVNTLQTVPGLATKPVPRNEVVQVLLRPASKQLADVKVRKAIVAALDRDALIASARQSGPSRAVPGRLVRGAAQPRPGTSGRDHGQHARRRRDRRAADRGRVTSRPSRVGTKAGKPLKLKIAAPRRPSRTHGSRTRSRRSSRCGASTAEVVTPRRRRTSSARPADSRSDIDIAVIPRVDAGDSAAGLASQYGCAGDAPDGATPSPVEPGRVLRPVDPGRRSTPRWAARRCSPTRSPGSSRSFRLRPCRVAAVPGSRSSWCASDGSFRGRHRGAARGRAQRCTRMAASRQVSGEP